MATTNAVPVPAPLSTDGDQYANWEFFRSQWENYEIATGLDEKEDKQRVATLLSVMSKDCYRIFEHLDITSEQRKKVDAILSKLEEYFKPKRNVIYERYIFHTPNKSLMRPFLSMLQSLEDWLHLVILEL